MGNNKVLLVCLIVVAVVLWVYLVLGLNENQNSSATIELDAVARQLDVQTKSITKSVSTIETTSSTAKIPFTEFIKNDGSYKCTVSQHIENTNMNGTIYIDKSNLYGEYSAMPGNKKDVSVIARDGSLFLWKSDTEGVKTKVATDEFVRKIGDYNCEPWTADSSLFEIPKNITFTETN